MRPVGRESSLAVVVAGAVASRGGRCSLSVICHVVLCSTYRTVRLKNMSRDHIFFGENLLDSIRNDTCERVRNKPSYVALYQSLHNWVYFTYVALYQSLHNWVYFSRASEYFRI